MDSANNFLDIFLNEAELISYSSDLTKIAEYVRFSRDLKIREAVKVNYQAFLRDNKVYSEKDNDIDSDARFDKYRGQTDESVLGVSSEIRVKDLAFHVSDLDFVALSKASVQDISQDLETALEGKKTYGNNNIIIRSKFFLSEKPHKIAKTRYNKCLKLSRLVHRFDFNVDVSLTVQNFQVSRRETVPEKFDISSVGVNKNGVFWLSPIDIGPDDKITPQQNLALRKNKLTACKHTLSPIIRMSLSEEEYEQLESIKKQLFKVLEAKDRLIPVKLLFDEIRERGEEMPSSVFALISMEILLLVVAEMNFSKWESAENLLYFNLLACLSKVLVVPFEENRHFHSWLKYLLDKG